MSEERTALKFSEAEIVVLRDKYAKFTPAEFDAFLAAAARYQLNPLANQIYARLQPETQRNARSVTYAAQIDGYRLIADRTGSYAGNDDPIFDSEKSPQKATVAVYKFVAGQKCKFEASARWDQYCPSGNQDFMWKRMPHLMLGKCAEALALRKAFPAELSGLYTLEEMQQADGADESPERPASEANPFREEQRKREQPNTTQPSLKDQIANAGSAVELTSLLTKEVGLHPVKENADRWKRIGVDAKVKIESSGWPDTHKEAAMAVLAGIRNQLKGDLPEAAPAQPTPGDPSKAPAFERLAGWVDQQESAASLADVVKSLESSAKFVDLRANAPAMAKVIAYAIEKLMKHTDDESWPFDACSVAGQEIYKIRDKYAMEADSIDTFGGGPDSATPASNPAG